MSRRLPIHFVILLICGLLCAAVVQGQSCVPDELGIAKDFNVFTFGDIILASTGTQGRVAGGGDVDLRFFGLGQTLSPSGGTRDDLIVGQDLTFTDGSIDNGNIVYGGTATITRVGIHQGTARQGTPINFNQALADLGGASLYWSALPANGEVEITPGDDPRVLTQLTGSDPTLNIFDLPGDVVSNTHTLEISVPSGSSVLLNVDGSTVEMKSFGYSLSGTWGSKVLWNLHQATSLDIQSIGVQGSILAPFAVISFNDGNINGHVIAGGLTGTGFFVSDPFTGCLPDYDPTAGLQVSLTTSVLDGTVDVGEVVSLTAQPNSVDPIVEVRFLANNVVFATDTSEPFEASLLIEASHGPTLSLRAEAVDAGGTASSLPAIFAVDTNPPVVEVPTTLTVESLDFTEMNEGRVLVDSQLIITFDRPVDPATIVGSVSLTHSGITTQPAITLAADGVTATVTPASPLTEDAFYDLEIAGVQGLDGSDFTPVTGAFITFQPRTRVSGTVLDPDAQPLEGIEVHIGNRSAFTNELGVFVIDDAPTGAQLLEVVGGTFGGETYAPLEFDVDVMAGVDDNGLPRPIFLPALAIAGGLDIVNGVATGTGVLTAPEVPGMQLDLNGVTVRNEDGTLFTGRMSITEVPAENLPMVPPTGVFSSSFVTIQPAHLFLNPPAPITYPNLDNALPGEIIPLWHFDHEVWDWVNYGNATVALNGSGYTSNPGQGLPATGWGSPQPPMAFTTVTGTVVDNDGFKLHWGASPREQAKT